MPSYIETYKKGELHKRIEKAYGILNRCWICPWECGVNRLAGELGECNTGERPIISDYMPHFGEEAPLVGTNGSGAIFIAYCNLKCVFCQTYDISHLGEGTEVSLERFAEIMVSLQQNGCHNINFITPSHVVPQILGALPLAIENGLRIPLIYNTGGYDSMDALELLDGIFDVYMPDFKFWDPEITERFLGVKDYPEVAKVAIREMHRQVGDLDLDNQGIAQRGLIVRHLVMPGAMAGTREIMRFLVKEISPNTYVNIMGHYRLCDVAERYPELNRSITREEYKNALDIAKDEGITRLDQTHAHLYPLILGET